MRVLCIDNKPRPASYNPSILKYIQEGVDYEVESVENGMNKNGEIGVIYYLVGVNTKPHGFAVDRFVPLSEVDKLELVSTKEECV